MSKSKIAAIVFSALGLIGGSAATIAMQTHAADSTSTTTAAATANPSGNTNPMPNMRHAPLGNDGTITAINGNTISMQEEADEGGAVYSVDATNAGITNNGATATIADLKVGDKIMVEGTVTGTNVVATKIMDGKMGHGFGG